jgi:hypothetical protein
MADTIQLFYSASDRIRASIEAEDRQGVKHLHPLISLSIGALIIDSNIYSSHHEVSEACVNAKKQAKKISGNSLFVERRGEVY